MLTTDSRLPYFDLLLAGRASGDPVFRSFESHVHWGYWPSPASALGTDRDLMDAMQRLDDEVLRLAELVDGMRVLDVGCGFGGTITSIDQRHREMTIVGVNIDERQLAVARGAVRSRSGNQLEFIAADGCRLPLADASFDRVMAIECIFHMESRERFAREASRVLRPGGVLVVSDFVPRSTDPRTLWFGRGIHRMIERGYGRQSAEWPRGGYLEIAEAAGLDLVLDRDITANTLPTYSALRRVMRAAPGAAKRLRLALATTELLSRLRLIRYRIVVFRKRPVSPSTAVHAIC